MDIVVPCVQNLDVPLNTSRNLGPQLDHVASETGWVIRQHHNRIRAGDVSLYADFVLDPWASGRPEIFKAETFLKRWPLETWPVDLNPWGG